MIIFEIEVHVGIMYQSIPSVTIPPGNPGASDLKFCPRGQRSDTF